MQVWKFKLGAEKKQAVQIPKDANVLCAQWNDDALCIWAECDTSAPYEERVFEVFGTGHEIPCDMGVQRKYIGTVQVGSMGMGILVFHVYERIN